tara:strand:- start:1532 stop:3319 length:1788 start_codon:yes stop_codon:yes gene_type:complete
MRILIDKSILILGIFFMIAQLSLAQTYTIERSMNLSEAMSFSSKLEHGIKINKPGTGWKVQVELKSKERHTWSADALCNDTILDEQVYLFGEQVTSNTNGQYSSEPLLLGAQEYERYRPGWFCWGVRTSSSNYRYRLRRNAYLLKVKTIEKSLETYETSQGLETKWVYYRSNTAPVLLTVTLTGGVTLSEIESIKIPGLGIITQADFTHKTKFDSMHACYSDPTDKICATYADIRSIPELDVTDFKIQAHRGIWGKYNENQENTLSAMEKATAQGYPLLETDIMPYGVTNYSYPNQANFAKPTGLAAFHDFVLERYTNGTGFIMDRGYSYLKNLRLKKPRSTDLGDERILFYAQNGYEKELPATQSGLLGFAAHRHKVGLLIDMKNLENKGSGADCTEFCEFEDQAYKNISLFHNMALAITKAKLGNNLKYLTFKTYLTYNELKTGLLAAGVVESDFRKVLWAPIIADAKGTKNAEIVMTFLKDWFMYNKSVLYYETNFFNEGDYLLNNDFCIGDNCYNVMEYIYRMSGRRAGIFSEEPVGSKGVVNRWGTWNLKKDKSKGEDRRGDHLWLLSKPFFKHAVITTDRPDIWNQLKN